MKFWQIACVVIIVLGVLGTRRELLLALIVTILIYWANRRIPS